MILWERLLAAILQFQRLLRFLRFTAYGSPFTAYYYYFHHFRRKIFIIRPKKAVNITKAATSPIGIATKTLSFKTNISSGIRMNRISPITISARHPVRKSLLNLCSTGFSSISFIVPYPWVWEPFVLSRTPRYNNSQSKANWSKSVRRIASGLSDEGKAGRSLSLEALAWGVLCGQKRDPK